MRNAFIVSATLLLVGVLGGGYTAFRVATTHEEAAKPAVPAQTAAAAVPEGTSTIGSEPAQSGNATLSDTPAPVAGSGTATTAATTPGEAPKISTTTNTSPSESTTVPDPQGGRSGVSTANASPSSNASGTQAASSNPGGMVGSPGTKPAAAASAAEGAAVVARDRASGTSPATVPTKPTSAINPSGQQSAPAGSASVPQGNVSTPAGGNAATTSPSAPTPQTGDPAAGQALFAGVTIPAVNCSVCHGANGKGGIGANLTTPDGPKFWTDAQFMLALRQGQAPNQVLNATMPRFSPQQLSDAQIVNIHAYVKSLE